MVLKSLPSLIQSPSPNFDSRHAGQPVEILVMHYTGMITAAAALERLCDPQAKVSAHYLIDEDGQCYQLVDEAYRAWHAGAGAWRHWEDVNGVSIGIEIVNPGHEHGYRPFPLVQMQAVAGLANSILQRHPVLPCNVIAHSDLAPQRKEDPGELFDWAWLAGQGIGLWAGIPAIMPITTELVGDEVRNLQQRLAAYGYPLVISGVWDEQTQACIRAFQRHFRPGLLSGQWDSDCEARLAWLLAKV